MDTNKVIDTFEIGEKTILIDTIYECCISVPTKQYSEEDLNNPNSIINKAFNQRRKFMQSINRKYINTVFLLVTSNCNLSCNFCAVRANINTKNKKESNINKNNLIEYIVPFLKKLQPRRIIISGGEPFLVENLVEMLEYLYDKLKISIIIQSNGLLITEEKIRALKGKVERIEISTGHYNNLNNLEKVISIIKKEKIDVVLSYVYNRNKEKLLRIIDITENYKTSFILNFISEVGNAMDNSIKPPTAHEKLDLFKFLACYILEKNYLKSNLVEIFFNRITIKKNCGALGKLLVIYPDGEGYLCHSLNNKEYSIGNIMETKIEEILNKWNTIIASKQCRSLFCVDEKTPCRSCKIRYLCGGTCGATDYYGTTPKDICILSKFFICYNLLYYNPKKSNKENLKTLIELCDKREKLINL